MSRWRTLFSVKSGTTHPGVSSLVEQSSRTWRESEARPAITRSGAISQASFGFAEWLLRAIKLADHRLSHRLNERDLVDFLQRSHADTNFVERGTASFRLELYERLICHHFHGRVGDDRGLDTSL